MITPRYLSSRLSERCEQVCRHLLPGGKRKAHDWVAGDLDGGKGDSLKIRIAGEDRQGVWSDFATGESGGDLLDLWCAVKRISLREAVKEVTSYLGEKMDGEASKPKKEYRQPPKPACSKIKPLTPAHGFLTGRGLTDETMADFKLAMTDKGEIVFPYLKPDGRFVNAKYRGLPKTFRQEGGAEPCLFGWQAIELRHSRSRAVIVTEGEIDAMSLHQLGFPALSVPMGGGDGHKQDWIESDFDELQRFDTFYLCLDNDEPGRKATDDLVQRLGCERCRIIELPYKDANEGLMAGMTADQFKLLWDGAKTRDPDELKPASSFLDRVLELFAGEHPDKAAVGIKTPWESVGRRLMFRPRETTLWSGFSGHGKSLVINQIAAYAMAQETRWCLASMEMPAERTLQRMLLQMQGGKINEDQIRHLMGWMHDKHWLFDVTGTAKVERMMKVFEYAVRRYEIKNFVVDSLAKCGIDEDDWNGQKRLVDRLSDFARHHNAHVHLVSHARKGESESAKPGKHDVRGSTAITDMVDNVITVWRDKREDAGQDHTCELAVCKQRHGGWEGIIKLWYDETSMRYQDFPDTPLLAYA